MRCDRCGLEAIVLKTCRWRIRSEQMFVLCDCCWLPISGAVWVIPGTISCFGKCSRCGSWESVRDLADVKPGGRKNAWVGICEACR